MNGRMNCAVVSMVALVFKGGNSHLIEPIFRAGAVEEGKIVEAGPWRHAFPNPPPSICTAQYEPAARTSVLPSDRHPIFK